MAYAQALLARDVYREKEELEAQASKKDLYSGLGRTAGSLAALAITGGTAAPAMTAAWATGLTLAGGAAGSKLAGEVEKGEFFKRERKELRKRLDPFGEENIVGGVYSGLTAGLGQKLKMAKDVSAAQRVLPEGATAADLAKAGEDVRETYKGIDFAGSTLGRTKVGKFLLGAKEFGLEGAKEFGLGVKEFGLKDTLAREFGIGGQEYAERVTKEGQAQTILQEYEWGGGKVPHPIELEASGSAKVAEQGQAWRASMKPLAPSSISQITQQAPRGRRDWTFSPSRGLFDWLQSKGLYKPDLEARERLLPSGERFV